MKAFWTRKRDGSMYGDREVETSMSNPAPNKMSKVTVTWYSVSVDW